MITICNITVNRHGLPTFISVLLRRERLAPLLDQARSRESLGRAVETLLPAECRGHCRLGGFEGGRFVLLADSAAWATRLRYSAPEIREQLRRLPGGRGVTQVQVRVSPPASAAPSTERTRPLERPSAASGRALQDIAEAETDPQLRAALLRLARRSRGTTVRSR